MHALREKIARRKAAGLAEVSGIKTKNCWRNSINLRCPPRRWRPYRWCRWSRWPGRWEDRRQGAQGRAGRRRPEGAAAGSSGYLLLEGWLDQQPERRLLDVWKGYVAAWAPSLSGRQAGAPGRPVGRARAWPKRRRVARFGSRISKAEQAVLNELEQASVRERSAGQPLAGTGIH